MINAPTFSNVLLCSTDPPLVFVSSSDTKPVPQLLFPSFNSIDA